MHIAIPQVTTTDIMYGQSPTFFALAFRSHCVAWCMNYFILYTTANKAKHSLIFSLLFLLLIGSLAQWTKQNSFSILLDMSSGWNRHCRVTQSLGTSIHRATKIINRSFIYIIQNNFFLVSGRLVYYLPCWVVRVLGQNHLSRNQFRWN